MLLVDLPDESGGATADDNALLTSAAEALKKRYPEMFKPSQNCRAPHVNVDVLRNEMLKAEVRSEGCMHMRRRLHASSMHARVIDACTRDRCLRA